jgi:hypothetical protein
MIQWLKKKMCAWLSLLVMLVQLKNCGTSPTSSLHDNILNVHNMHMQVATIHYVATKNSIGVEVM